MRTIYCLLLTAVMFGCVGGEEAKLKDTLQGTWRRPNSDEFTTIEGDTYTLYEQNRPFNPVRSGTLTFDDEKGVATVVCDSGHTCYFWSCGVWPKTGQRVIANEVFSQNGQVWKLGQILYRTDTEKGGNE